MDDDQDQPAQPPSFPRPVMPEGGWTVRSQCPECGAFTLTHETEKHTFNCSLITLEDAKRQLLAYHASWLKLEMDDRQWRKRLAERAEAERLRLKEKLKLWQGKFALVKAENNALRRKAAKQPSFNGHPDSRDPRG